MAKIPPTNNHDGKRNDLIARVRNVTSAVFDELALDIFRYQFTYNPVYQHYCSLIGTDPAKVRDVAGIPCLPISLFKTHDIRTNVWQPVAVFESSTTTGRIPSKHVIRDLEFYHENARRGFASVMGYPVKDCVWLALLPSPEERPSSSLVSMAADFIAHGLPGSRFVSMDDAIENVRIWERKKARVILLGLSFALLDLAEQSRSRLPNTVIIETGGMKGRRSEPTRSELHDVLRKHLGVTEVYSEYGMTELMSQAWSIREYVFTPSPALRIQIRDLSDPFAILPSSARGGMNCIDLANVDSCAFIATEDIGVVVGQNMFEVLGRVDASELRGCNLMINPADA